MLTAALVAARSEEGTSKTARKRIGRDLVKAVGAAQAPGRLLARDRHRIEAAVLDLLGSARGL